MRLIILILLSTLSFYSSSTVIRPYFPTNPCNMPNVWATKSYFDSMINQCTGYSYYYWSGINIYGKWGASATRAFAVVQFTSSASCPSGTQLVDGVCQNQCEPLAGNESATNWDYFKYGNKPVFCSSGCELVTKNVSVCFIKGGTCSGTAVITGSTCTNEGTAPGGNIPDEVPQGCELIQDTYVCPEDTSGDGKPNNGAPLDTAAKCDYAPDDSFVCSGGSFAPPDYQMTDPTKPLDKIEDGGGSIGGSNGAPIDVEAPPNVGDSSDEREQIKQLNQQINRLMTALNEDNNKNFADVINELKDSNEFNDLQLKQIAESTNKQIDIWENMKLLQVQGTTDLVNAINGTTQYDDYRHNQHMANQKEMLHLLNQIANGSGNGGGSGDSDVVGAVDGLKEAITGVDTSKIGNHPSCKETDTCEPLFEHGVSDELMKESIAGRLANSASIVSDGLLTPLTNLDISNGSKPNYTLDMTGFGYGYFDLEDYVNFAYLYLVLRALVYFTTVMTCRKIIFGG